MRRLICCAMVACYSVTFAVSMLAEDLKISKHRSMAAALLKSGKIKVPEPKLVESESSVEPCLDGPFGSIPSNTESPLTILLEEQSRLLAYRGAKTKISPDKWKAILDKSDTVIAKMIATINDKSLNDEAKKLRVVELSGEIDDVFRDGVQEYATSVGKQIQAKTCQAFVNVVVETSPKKGVVKVMPTGLYLYNEILAKEGHPSILNDYDWRTIAEEAGQQLASDSDYTFRIMWPDRVTTTVNKYTVPTRCETIVFFRDGTIRAVRSK